MRANAPARPELPEFQVAAQAAAVLNLEIINRALRAAALAPTVFDALDVCADALLDLSRTIRAEVRHG